MRSRPPLVRTVLLLAGAFVTAVVLVLALVRIDRVVVADGAVEGPSRAVRAPRDGVVLELVVDAGTRVEAGAVLARLDARALDAERAEFALRRAALATRRAELEREKRHLLESLQPAEREGFARALEAARLVVEAAQAKEARFAELERQGLVEKTELEDAVLARKLAQVELEEVRADERGLGARETAAGAELDARIAELGHASNELEIQAAEVERRAGQSDLVAPVAGCLLGPARAELVGRAVHAGDEVLRVAVAGVDAFVAHVDDRGRARVASGAPAKLRLEGYPWLVHGTVEAKVVQIADRADERGWLVRLAVDGNPPGPLYEGMSGKARIATEERVSIAWLVLEELFGLDSK
ncbi:MAG: biotin/lipoyl-binding protein [Planctomycetes bacterium]|nr:biotin/lipoyl-binding protein [Planctomycetota bacterium]